MSKRLDGINKIDRHDLAQSRKIVLDSIGESDEPKAKPTTNRPSRQLDGLVSSRKKQKRKTVNINPEESQKVKEILTEEEVDKKPNDDFANQVEPSQEEIEKIKQEEKMRIKELVKEKRQARKAGIKAAKDKIKQNKKAAKQAKKIERIAEKDKIKATKQGQKDLASQANEQAKQRRIQAKNEVQVRKAEVKAIKDKIKQDKKAAKQAKKIEKITKKEEARKLAEKKEEAKRETREMIIRQKQEEKRRIKAETQKAKEEKMQLKELKQKAKLKIRESRKRKRRKAIKKLVFNFKKRCKNIWQFIFSWAGVKAMAKFLSWLIIWFIVLAIFLYFILAVILLRFNSDKKINQIIVNNLPVPTIITKLGFIDYQGYLKLKDNLSLNYNTNELKAVIREKAIEQLILQNLIGKYKIDLDNKTVDEIYKEINNNLVLDQQFNKVVFIRIDNIIQFLAGGENFSILGKKYGDNFGQVDMNKLAKEKIGQINETIITADGYYFIQGKDFIFIKAITLDDYLAAMQSKLKVWILVK